MAPSGGRQDSFRSIDSLAPVNDTLSGTRILVVEDNDDNAEMFATVLQLEGAATRIAGTADQALQEIRAFRPHVVISDLGLPGKDGYAFVRELRAMSPDDGGLVPAIALSGYSDAKHVQRAILAGFQLHVPKPFQASCLVAHVARLAGRTTSES